MSNQSERVRHVISKLGWMTFAGYVVATLCGADKVASATSVITVACAVAVNGMKAADDIQEIIAI